MESIMIRLIPLQENFERRRAACHYEQYVSKDNKRAVQCQYFYFQVPDKVAD